MSLPIEEILAHAMAFAVGCATVGSGIYRQLSVHDGRYLAVTAASFVASLSGVFGIKYVADARYDLYMSFSLGCWAVSMGLTLMAQRRKAQHRQVPRAAGMVVLGDGQILGVMKDAGWGLPVETLQGDEDTLSAAHRSLLSETGCRADVLDIPPYIAWDDKANHVVTMYFAKLRDGAPNGIENPAAAGGHDARWVSAEDLATGAYPQFNQKALEYVQSRTIGLGNKSGAPA
jgi:ADP-ribose pyrophosphatase YjhB (NUDIX family)